MTIRKFILFTSAVLALEIVACNLIPPVSTIIDKASQNNLTSELVATSTPPIISQVIDTNAIHLTEKEAGYCKALAPEDWVFTSLPPYVGADLFSPDQSSHAAWGITSIYKALYPTPQSALVYLLGAMGYKNAILVGQPFDVGYGFTNLSFTSSIGRQGQLFFKTYDLDPNFYVISVYLGATTNENWEMNGPEATSAAVSIRCVSQLRPVIAQFNLDLSDPSDPADNPEVDLSEKWSEAILGFENVYSPSTGAHYLAPLESYWETGPDGGGYYRSLPDSGYEKLEYGFGDY